MSSPLYLLRHPPDALSSALYSPHDLHGPVFALITSAHLAHPTQCITVIEPGEGSNVIRRGDHVTYRQFLESVIEAGKVITL
jgi:hypothetical protein